jgi:hypothetical protein
MNVSGRTGRDTLPQSSAVLPDFTVSTPLTGVSLAYVEQRVNLWLRFGHPLRDWRIDRWQRRALFTPAALFCRVRYESNDYGTTRWQLMVLQACLPLDAMQRIAGIHPGACLLLHAEGERQVQPVLEQMAAMEALGFDLAAVSPAYWRTLHNRVSARMPLPVYTAERHATYLAGEGLR